MKLIQFAFGIVVISICLLPASAQKTSSIINADNVLQLRAVQQVEFDKLPQQAGRVDNGWFELSPDGRIFAFLNRANSIVLWDIQSGFVRASLTNCNGKQDEVGGFVDGSFLPDSTAFIATYIMGQTSYIAQHPVSIDAIPDSIICNIPGIPLHIWSSESNQIWLELLPMDYELNPLVMQFILPHPERDQSTDGELLDSIPSGPENDSESFIRVGRIEPPWALTVTQTAFVKRWSLETSETTAIAKLSELPGAGQITADGRFFAWVDQQFQSLHLLDFKTSEDRVVAQIDGTFIPFILLSSEADVIIGVNVDLEPVIVVWMVETGEEFILGDYRTCNRQPSMVRLSTDGTTLALGCDTGLDIWQVVPDEFPIGEPD